ncbi:acyl-CoA thioesterase 13 [Rhinolophus ferrumequinum]|uniref:Acyl-coenzyme A thioesterase 13 n=1 Tax=Rhinolophus ferrumequinum TaxID=59479 RepID=A0A7J7SV89_RHIFE|nr:acyl-coenzyme A thioesterase 13 isoform X1 [Rhinolophus ferrumequinum]KAF6292348.1 acyl-CoA thioesterase 13 [Rhinolophus ferrumequinum]
MSLTQKLREVMKAIGSVHGFDRVLEKVTLVSAAPGKVICELKVEEEHTNKMGTLHGGLTATLVDSISTMALLCTERGAPGVSVDMNITVHVVTQQCSSHQDLNSRAHGENAN